MILRRQYFSNKAYAWYFHPEIKTYHEMLIFQESNPEINCEALDNATYYMDKLTKEEQDSMWKQTYINVMNHTRWFLDHLDQTCEFKVRWNHYGKKRKTVGLPPDINNIWKEAKLEQIDDLVAEEYKAFEDFNK